MTIDGLRQYIFPYAACDPPWWGGMSLLNDSPWSQVVRVQVCRQNGSVSKRRILTLAPFEQMVLGSEFFAQDLRSVRGRFFVRITCAKSTLPRLLEGGAADGGFSFDQADKRPDLWPPVLDRQVRFFCLAQDENPYFRYYGNVVCNGLRADYLSALEMICAAVYYQFPDRIDRLTGLGDCCPRSGKCPGHPGHGMSGMEFDANYFTFERNTTQYRANGGGEMVPIWDGDILLVKAFDWRRVYAFWALLLRAFPGCRISTIAAIRDYVFGLAAANGLQVWGEQQVCTGTRPEYNHHTHMHVAVAQYADEIAWGSDLEVQV